MIARPESSSRPADDTSAALVALLAVAVFVAGWVALHYGFYAQGQIVDTPVYKRYGDAILDGRLPYRDFELEYPPAALPVFALPAVADDGGDDSETYRDAFEALMLLCGTSLVLLVAWTLRSLAADPRRLAGALTLVALSPLLLGSLVLTRFDFWPAALAAAALAALVAGRARLAFAALGFAVAAKLYAGVLLPLALAYVAGRLGRRAALICAALFAGVLAVCFGPFLVLAPEGVWTSVERQLGRPLQLESLGSAILLAARELGAADVAVRSSHGSQNVVGAGAGAVAIAHSVVQAAAVVAVWVWFARGPAERERLLRAAAAALVAFVALGKVVSPQFLIWLVPLVPLVRGRRGLLASALLGLALVLTQTWFPSRYWQLADELDPVAVWLVLARDLTLLAILAVLVWPLRGRGPNARRLDRSFQTDGGQSPPP